MKSTCLLAVIYTCLSSFSLAGTYLSDYTNVYQTTGNNSPAYDDIIFTSRWERTTNPGGLNYSENTTNFNGSLYNMYEAAEQFHATSLEWIYSESASVMTEFRNRGIQHIHATLNSTPEDDPDASVKTWDLHRLENIDGTPHETHLSGQAMLCVNKPSARSFWLDKARRVLEAGPDGVQHDGRGFNAHYRFAGACFCDWCMTGSADAESFTDYLWRSTTASERLDMGITQTNKNGFNFKTFCQSNGWKTYWDFATQKLKNTWSRFHLNSVNNFHLDMKAQLETEYPGFSYSANNGNIWQTYDDAFDYGNAEWEANKTIVEFYDSFIDGRTRQKAQIYNQPKVDSEPTSAADFEALKNLTQRSIGLSYAYGIPMTVPWDTFLGTTNGVGWDRYFGRPQDYAHLYGFVRACSLSLVDYEVAYSTGNGVVDVAKRYSRWSTPLVDVMGGSGEVHVVAKARPGNQKKPIVIHLVDWAENPSSFKIKLKKNHLFNGTMSTDVRLFVPRDYDATLHSNARATGNFGALRQRINPSIKNISGNRVEISIPKLDHHWGILIIRP